MEEMVIIFSDWDGIENEDSVKLDSFNCGHGYGNGRGNGSGRGYGYGIGYFKSADEFYILEYGGGYSSGRGDGNGHGFGIINE
jgi:hypothetical protein